MRRCVSRAVAAIPFVAVFGFAASVARADGPSTTPSTRPAAVAPATRPAAAPSTRPPVAPPSTRPAVPAFPASPADLRAIEQRVEEVHRAVNPAVVGVQVGGGQGSGVIVSRDGYVLTAAHVSGEPGQRVWLILPDGRRVRAKTLGANQKIDAGLIKITDDGDWPFVPLGRSGGLRPGQWVVGLGHPGGYRVGRPPVLRLGRVLRTEGPTNFVMSDVTLVGGDSGGPLFDLDGRVVGIHSRIGPSTLNNMHTPVDAYGDAWDRLAAGESWGGSPLAKYITDFGPLLGIGGDDTADDGKGARINSVAAGGPADKAGVKPGDVVTSFDGKPVRSLKELAGMISRKKAGDRVAVVVDRDGKRVELTATLVKRPPSDE